MDVHLLFDGRADDYSALDLIHSNDEGYRVIAEAVIEAIGELP